MTPRRRDAFVLCYHAVSPDWMTPLSVTPDRLAEHLSYLTVKGYESVTFTEAALGTDSGRYVAVTFDDGCRSVFDVARPVLDRFGVVGTVFVPTQYIGAERPMSWRGIEQWTGTPHEQELLPMSWEEAGELAEAGWEIGSHTVSHPHLTELSDERLRTELLDSRVHCERMLGSECRSLAYPYGDHDDRVVAATAAAGYEAACAARMESVGGALRWPRILAHEEDEPARFRRKASLPARRLRYSPAGKQAERGYAALLRLIRR